MTDPTSIAQQPAAALDAILALFEGDSAPLDALARIKAIAEKAAVFDRNRMRLRFDDPAGNRCFVQYVLGSWQAYDVKGGRLGLAYPFGTPIDEAAIQRDLSAALTMGGVIDAAMCHQKRHNDVQIEAVWERHAFDGTSFRHTVPSWTADRAA